jgi:hypothetical protein
MVLSYWWFVERATFEAEGAKNQLAIVEQRVTIHARNDLGEIAETAHGRSASLR